MTLPRDCIPSQIRIVDDPGLVSDAANLDDFPGREDLVIEVKGKGGYQRRFSSYLCGLAGVSWKRRRDIMEVVSRTQLPEEDIGLLETVTPAPPGDDMGLEPGCRIRQYEIIRELGRGGMGRVLLARDTLLGRRVALKFLLNVTRVQAQRFLIEARTTAQVQHENIVIIHEVNEIHGNPYMVLEYLEGETLRDQIGEQPLPPHRAIEIMLPVVRALCRAHQDGVVHRDLKPENILITNSGQVKVLDFGIAKLFITCVQNPDEVPYEAALPEVPSTNLTNVNGLVGTLPYMSPEQWGAGQINHHSDIWAVGIMLFEMLTGALPSAKLDPTKLRFQVAISRDAMPSVSDHVSGVPSALASIVATCLEKARDKRFPDAADLLEALEALLPGHAGRKLAEGENPFPGLVAFQEQDADRFFGRSRDITRAVQKIREVPLIGIVGSSGVGKSSMVRAGLVPSLKSSGAAWEVFTIRPGRKPISSLVNLLEPLVDTSNAADIAKELAAHREMLDRIRELPGYVGRLLRARARRNGSKILLFVDQFEELYTLVADPAERIAFTSALAAVGDDPESPLRVVVTMRSDFLDRAGENAWFLGQLTQGILFLQPPERDGLREALSRPVEMLGYKYENPGMLGAMLRSLDNTPGALPLMQFAASKLWDKRDQKRKLLTQASYQRMGGIEGTLASHADETLAGLGKNQQKLARVIFQRLVTPHKTRAIRDLSELRTLHQDHAEIDTLIRHLVRARLLVVQARNDAEGKAVEIVHESLISEWPSLRRWLEEGQEDAAFLEQLRSAASQWEQKNRSAGLLWRGEASAEAERFERRYKGELAAGERAFLQAVLGLASRSKRRRRVAFIGAIVFLSALVVAGGIALVAIRQAQQEAVTQAKAARSGEERAQGAEKAVRDQLSLIQEKEAARIAAEKTATKAEEQAAKAEEQAAKAEEQAAKAEEQAQQGLHTIAETKEDLKAALKKAKKETARAEGERAKTKKLLEQRNRELQKLKAQGRKINKTLD